MEPASLTADTARILAALPITAETTAHPVLIMLSGLPGTGKSFLARRIAQRLPVVIVASDQVRKILFRVPSYSSIESAYVHRVAHAVIEKLLVTGRRVVYDATNLAEVHREQVYHLAERNGARLIVVLTKAPEPVVRERLERRSAHRGQNAYSDADWEVYQILKREVDPVRRDHFVVDTRSDIDRALFRIVRAAR